MRRLTIPCRQNIRPGQPVQSDRDLWKCSQTDLENYRLSLDESNEHACHTTAPGDDVIKWKHLSVTGPLWGESTGDRWIPSQRPVTRSFEVFFDRCLSKQSRCRWCETPSRSLWSHYNEEDTDRNILRFTEPIFYLWLYKVSAKERRRCICNVFSHWQGPCSAIHNKNKITGDAVEIWEWTINLIPRLIMDVITF